MRWSVREPREGEHRLVRRFLWLPLTLQGECRWLERVVIRQRYASRMKDCGSALWRVCEWRDEAWVDPEVK